MLVDLGSCCVFSRVCLCLVFFVRESPPFVARFRHKEIKGSSQSLLITVVHNFLIRGVRKELQETQLSVNFLPDFSVMN